jgi:hypothetical protein
MIRGTRSVASELESIQSDPPGSVSASFLVGLPIRAPQEYDEPDRNNRQSCDDNQIYHGGLARCTEMVMAFHLK